MPEGKVRRDSGGGIFAQKARSDTARPSHFLHCTSGTPSPPPPSDLKSHPGTLFFAPLTTVPRLGPSGTRDLSLRLAPSPPAASLHFLSHIRLAELLLHHGAGWPDALLGAATTKSTVAAPSRGAQVLRGKGAAAAASATVERRTCRFLFRRGTF